MYQNTCSRMFSLLSRKICDWPPLMVKPKMWQERHKPVFQTTVSQLTLKIIWKAKEALYTHLHKTSSLKVSCIFLFGCFILLSASHVFQKQLTTLLEDKSHTPLSFFFFFFVESLAHSVLNYISLSKVYKFAKKSTTRKITSHWSHWTSFWAQKQMLKQTKD